jgi:integrase
MHEVEWRGMPQRENVDPFTGAELRAVPGVAVDRDADLATLLRVWAQSGMRAGEVCGLQWQDLDFVAGTALVRRT